MGDIDPPTRQMGKPRLGEGTYVPRVVELVRTEIQALACLLLKLDPLPPVQTPLSFSLFSGQIWRQARWPHLLILSLLGQPALWVHLGLLGLGFQLRKWGWRWPRVALTGQKVPRWGGVSAQPSRPGRGGGPRPLALGSRLKPLLAEPGLACVLGTKSVFAEPRKHVSSSSLGCQRQVSGSAGQGCCLRPSYPLDFAPGNTVGRSHTRDTPLGASPICGQGWGRGDLQDPVFGAPASPPRCPPSGWAQLEKRLAADGYGCLGSLFPSGQFMLLLS